MRVIIAGGSGLIGRELTSSLVGLGAEVIILSRSPQMVYGLPAGAQAVLWDGVTLQDWAKEIDGTDVVVNLTGENLSGEGLLPSRWTKERKVRLVESRVNSGVVLTKAIAQASQKPSVFIQASGVGFYGTQQPKLLTEGDPAGNDFSANLCIEWEASSQPVEAMGVRRVVTRNGVVLSTISGALRPMLLPYKLFVGGPLGSGRQVHSWIHIADEVAAILFLIKKNDARGVYNLTSPNPMTNDEFGRTIAMVMKRPHYFPIPAFIMRLAFGEVASMLLEGQAVIPKKLLDAGFQFKFPLLADALRNLLAK
jgi:uncharacterized protein (TIGR01777 family)